MSKYISADLKQELLQKYSDIQTAKTVCYECGSPSVPELEMLIFWHKYSFCSELCQYEVEHTMRKLWRRECRQKGTPFPEYYST
jgi:hypothetical protein